MHILENSFHRRRFIDISASFTPHSDSERLLNSELLYLLSNLANFHSRKKFGDLISTQFIWRYFS
jgi:hypothetical protein